MAKIPLGSITFAKLEDAKCYLREKVENYEIDKPVPNADILVWFQVIQRHEWFDEYVTHGIKYFAATRSEQRPNLRNMVVVNDQGEQNWRRSGRHCGPKVMSAISGKPLTERRCHVHHGGKPLLQIVDEFLLLNKHRWVEMETEAAGATGYRLRDRIIAADWADFHRTHATLKSYWLKKICRAARAGTGCPSRSRDGY